MRSEIDNELSKRPIKAFDEMDLYAAEKAAMELRSQIETDKKLAVAWGSEHGRIIQADLIEQRRKLEREGMDIPVTDTVKLAINRGMWKQLDLLIYRHILKKGEAIRKEGLVAALVRRTTELAARLRNKSTKQEA